MSIIILTCCQNQNVPDASTDMRVSDISAASDRSGSYRWTPYSEECILDSGIDDIQASLLLSIPLSNTPYSEECILDSGIDNNKDACMSWMHSNLKRRFNNIPEQLEPNWPIGYENQVSEVDNGFRVSIINTPPRSQSFCTASSCIDHCLIGEAERRLEPGSQEENRAFSEFTSNMAYFCVTRVCEIMSKLYYDECLLRDNAVPEVCSLETLVIYDSCITSRNSPLVVEQLDLCINASIADNSEIPIEIDNHIPIGSIEYDLFTSNECDNSLDLDCNQDECDKCRENIITYHFNLADNPYRSRTGRYYQYFFDNCQNHEGYDNHCNQCIIYENEHDDSGQTYNDESEKIPLGQIQVVHESINTSSQDMVCRDIYNPRIKWKESIMECVRKDEGEIYANYSRGTWYPYENDEITLFDDLRPYQDRIWKFYSESYKPPQPVQLVRFARCLGNANRILFNWKFDINDDGICDSVKCPEILSPTGDPSFSEEENAYGQSSEIVFLERELYDGDIYTTTAEFEIVFAIDEQVPRTREAVYIEVEPLSTIEADITLIEPNELGVRRYRVTYPEMPINNEDFGEKLIKVCINKDYIKNNCENNFIIDDGNFLCLEQKIEVFWRYIDISLYQTSYNDGNLSSDGNPEPDKFNIPENFNNNPLMLSGNDKCSDSDIYRRYTMQDFPAENALNYWSQIEIFDGDVNINDFIQLVRVVPPTLREREDVEDLINPSDEQILALRKVEEFREGENGHGNYGMMAAGLSYYNEVYCNNTTIPKNLIYVNPPSLVLGVDRTPNFPCAEYEDIPFESFLTSIIHEYVHVKYWMDAITLLTGIEPNPSEPVKITDWSISIGFEHPSWNHYIDYYGDSEDDFRGCNFDGDEDEIISLLPVVNPIHCCHVDPGNNCNGIFDRDIFFEYENHDFDHDDVHNYYDRYSINGFIITSGDDQNTTMSNYSDEFRGWEECLYRDEYKCREIEIMAFCRAKDIMVQQSPNLYRQDWSAPGPQYREIGEFNWEHAKQFH